MADLTTKYMGLELKNPIIAGSSGMTDSVQNIRELERQGAAAVVIKSLFEEEIIMELNKTTYQTQRPGTLYPEIFDFFDLSEVEDTVTRYLRLIEDAKKEVEIPVIASVNCVTAREWTTFSKRFEEAGADALELNVFILPSDLNRSGEENEKVYFDVIEKVKNEVSIPVSLKISYYFSNLAQMIKKLSETGIDGLVLFNRFYSPDFDITNPNNIKIVPANIFSTPEELSTSLRWIAIMSQRSGCDLCASTGIHDGTAVIKQIIAGAQAVQVASTLYKNSKHRIQTMLDEVKSWMREHEYNSLNEFRGIMSQEKSADPAAFERAQFMKHFSEKY
ncbi:MAG: dihydroorotate dehydrogenase-like protein [Candidatus Kapaibacterium sp.]